MLLLALAGCSRKPKPVAETSVVPATSALAAASAPKARPPLPEQKPLAGLLCAVEEGLYRLRPDGGTEPILALREDGARLDAPGSIDAFSRGPDGALFAYATFGRFRVGSPLVPIWSFPGSPDGKAPGGSFLALGTGVVSWDILGLHESKTFPPTRLDDFKRVTLPEGVTSFDRVVIDGKNRLWGATYNALYVRSGEAWTKAELPAYPSVKGLVVYGGVVHALLLPKVAAYPEGPEAPQIAFELPGKGEAIVAGPRGLLVQLEPAENKRGAKVIRWDGKAVKPVPGEMDKLIAYDGAGVVWGREKEGFVAVESGDVRTFWPKGSIPDFARASIRACEVVGSYQTLPAVSPVRRGSAKGVLAVAGKPLANARVELCEELPGYVFSTKTPCGGYGVAGKTNAEGAFLLENVPIGPYQLTAELGAKWKGTSRLASSRLPLVHEGAVADFETIDLQ